MTNAAIVREMHHRIKNNLQTVAMLLRMQAAEGPGLTAQMMDDLFFGAQPGIPPYEVAPGDQNEERSAAIGATFQWALTADKLDVPAESEQLVDSIRAKRPNFEAMSNRELWEFAKNLYITYLGRFFSEHIFITFLATVPVGALTQICAAVGRAGDEMKECRRLGLAWKRAVAAENRVRRKIPRQVEAVEYAPGRGDRFVGEHGEWCARPQGFEHLRHPRIWTRVFQQTGVVDRQKAIECIRGPLDPRRGECACHEGSGTLTDHPANRLLRERRRAAGLEQRVRRFREVAKRIHQRPVEVKNNEAVQIL